MAGAEVNRLLMDDGCPTMRVTFTYCCKFIYLHTSLIFLEALARTASPKNLRCLPGSTQHVPNRLPSLLSNGKNKHTFLASSSLIGILIMGPFLHLSASETPKSTNSANRNTVTSPIIPLRKSSLIRSDFLPH